MTAGQVLSAIKVDVVKKPISIQPSILEFMKTRGRGSARVNLFGSPEPGSTNVLYQQMLVNQRQRMLDKYNFDVNTEQFLTSPPPPTTPNSDANETIIVPKYTTNHSSNAINDRLQENCIDINNADNELTDSLQSRGLTNDAITSLAAASADVCVPDIQNNTNVVPDDERVNYVKNDVVLMSDNAAKIDGKWETSAECNTSVKSEISIKATAAVSSSTTTSTGKSITTRKPYDRAIRSVTDFYRKTKSVSSFTAASQKHHQSQQQIPQLLSMQQHSVSRTKNI